LTAEGLVVRQPRKKLQIAPITLEDVDQAYEVRRLLEPHATLLVIASDDSAIADSLQGLLAHAKSIQAQSYEELDLEEYLSIDFKLFEIFLAAAGQTFFGEILAYVEKRSLRIRTFLEASSLWPDSMSQIITAEHIDIIEAMLQKNAPQALEAVNLHLTNGKVRTQKALAKRLKNPVGAPAIENLEGNLEVVNKGG